MAVSPFLLKDADSYDDSRNVQIKILRTLLAASWGTNPLSVSAEFGNTASLDAFSRLRTSQPVTVFDSTFQYDLQPLIYEPILIGTGGVAHDPTNSSAVLSVTAGGSGLASMQSYRYVRYQPGKSTAVFLTFVFGAAVAQATYSIGLGDGLNGFRLQRAGSAISFERDSTSAEGGESIPQSAWNLDRLDGTDKSGITLNLEKAQILVFDMQWLGVGRVRCGFDIDGVVYYAHEFNHANNTTHVYTTTLNLPVKATISTSAAAAASMQMICASVQSETTFNSIANRTTFLLESVDIVVTGNQPVLWELCLGVDLTGTNTFLDVNATYSGTQYNILGTPGSPLIVVASGYIAASASQKGAASSAVFQKYPITLDAAGAARAMGRLTLLATGLGGTSACRGSINWREIR